jgi:CheY-like chemotaxis protein
LLECSSEHDEVNFWFTVPSTFSKSLSPKEACEVGIPSPSGSSKVPSSPTSSHKVLSPSKLFPNAIPHGIPSFNSISAHCDALVISDPTTKLSKSDSDSPMNTARTSSPDNMESSKIATAMLLSDDSPVNTARTIKEYIMEELHIKITRVLLVDDSRMCQKVVTRALSNKDFVIEIANNGKEACNILAQNTSRFDVVLMDLRMPVMDGLTAIREIRGKLGLATLPIIVLTAEVGPIIRAEAVEAGASRFLSKPTKAKELIDVIKSVTLAG